MNRDINFQLSGWETKGYRFSCHVSDSLVKLLNHISLMGTTNYKESKEAFVSGATGSSILHVNLVSSVALVSPSGQLSTLVHSV